MHRLALCCFFLVGLAMAWWLTFESTPTVDSASALTSTETDEDYDEGLKAEKEHTNLTAYEYGPPDAWSDSASTTAR